MSSGPALAQSIPPSQNIAPEISHESSLHLVNGPNSGEAISALGTMRALGDDMREAASSAPFSRTSLKGLLSVLSLGLTPSNSPLSDNFTSLQARPIAA